MHPSRRYRPRYRACLKGIAPNHVDKLRGPMKGSVVKVVYPTCDILRKRAASSPQEVHRSCCDADIYYGCPRKACSDEILWLYQRKPTVRA